MHIAIFTDTFFPNIDGVITSTLENTKALVARGHTVTIVAPEFQRQYQEFEHKGVTVVRVPSIPTYAHKEYQATWVTNRRVRTLLRRTAVDVIHVQTPWTVGVIGRWCARTLDVPLVGTFHTFHADPEYLRNLGLKRLAQPVAKLVWALEVWFYNACDVVTCPSEITCQELRAQGCTADVRFVPNGIDTQRYVSESVTTTRARYATPTEKLLLFVGRVAPEKSIHVLLEALTIVLDSVPDTQLLIVGDGASRTELEALTTRLHLDAHVTFAGYMNNDTVIADGLFAAADIFVSASKTESGPVTVMEAHAHGTPCIGVDARNTPFLIDTNINGYIVQPDDPRAFADAIIRVLTDEVLRQQLGTHAREKGVQYDIQHVADTWESLYNELNDNHR